jgi:hypothetical protein
MGCEPGSGETLHRDWAKRPENNQKGKFPIQVGGDFSEEGDEPDGSMSLLAHQSSYPNDQSINEKGT